MVSFGVMRTEEKILATEGMLGVAGGLTMLLHPKTAHKHVFDKAPKAGITGSGSATGMTRIAGASLAAVSCYAMHAGLDGNHRHRTMAYTITAGHSAVGAGLGILALSGERKDATMNKDRLKLATGLLSVNALYYGWRAYKKRQGLL